MPTGRQKFATPAASPKALCRPPGGVNAGHRDLTLGNSAGIAPAWDVVQRPGGARREPVAERGIKPCSLGSSMRPACVTVKY
jgi:hypothetical protein